MAFTYIQSAGNNTGSGTTLVITLPQAASVNGLVIVNFFIAGGASSISVSDNASVPNTYAQAATQDPFAGYHGYQYYGVQVQGGATSITINWTTSVDCYAAVDEFRGNAITNGAVFDKTSKTNGPTATSSSVPSFSPTGFGELIVAGILFGGHPGAGTAGTGYTLGFDAGSTQWVSTEYRLSNIVSETAPFSWTTSQLWGEVAGAYFPVPPPVNFIKAPTVMVMR